MLEKINNDMMQAMKNHDKFKLTTLRMLKSSIIYESRAKEKHELSDDDILAIIKTQIKAKNSSIEEYNKYNRLDLVEGLEKEIEIISKYLPKELSEEELNKIIDDVFLEINPQSAKDMGKVIKEISLRVGVRADMKKVSNIVKEKLS